MVNTNRIGSDHLCGADMIASPTDCEYYGASGPGKYHIFNGIEGGLCGIAVKVEPEYHLCACLIPEEDRCRRNGCKQIWRAIR